MPELRWDNANTFSELCELGARFVSGEIDSPMYGGAGPIEETPRIASHLAELNRRGLFTSDSQVGLRDDAMSSQRAYVAGWCEYDTAVSIASRGMHSDLVVFLSAPGDESDVTIPVTSYDGWRYTRVGTMNRRNELSFLVESLPPDAAIVLANAWQVAVIDPVWGRDTYLWEVMLAPVREGFSILVHESLGHEPGSI